MLQDGLNQERPLYNFEFGLEFLASLIHYGPEVWDFIIKDQHFCVC